MNFYIIIILVSFVWILSEVILARITHSKTADSKDLDKSSLKFLWITIIVCVFVGVFLGIRGIGFISKNSLFISSSGLILIVLGLVIRWTAILTLKKYFTVNVSILSDHQIIDKGIYGIIRHPAYAGSLLSFLGLGLSFSNWLSTLIIFTPVLVVFIYRMRIEEKALVGFFGEEYISYSKTTKRLIPKIY